MCDLRLRQLDLNIIILSTPITQGEKKQMSFPDGVVKLTHAKRDSISGFQQSGIQGNGYTTKMLSFGISYSRTFGYDNFILLGIFLR
jgi:hypothetical protein